MKPTLRGNGSISRDLEKAGCLTAEKIVITTKLGKVTGVSNILILVVEFRLKLLII